MTEPSGDLRDIAVDAEGNLYVLRGANFNETTHVWYDCVYKYDPDGKFIKSWFVVVDASATSIAVDAKSYCLYIAEGGRIHRSDFNGTKVENWATLSGEQIESMDVDEWLRVCFSQRLVSAQRSCSQVSS